MFRNSANQFRHENFIGLVLEVFRSQFISITLFLSFFLYITHSLSLFLHSSLNSFIHEKGSNLKVKLTQGQVWTTATPETQSWPFPGLETL